MNRRQCRRSWWKVAILVTAAIAFYEIYYIMMTSQCSDEELKQSLAALCDLFHQGQVMGDLCSALCDTNEIRYLTCLNYRHGKRIVTVSYRGGNMVLKSKFGYLSEFPVLSYNYENRTFFPEDSDFNKMLIDTLALNFDVKIPERRDMLTRLWTVPYHELRTQDERRAAMRSIWSLVQQDEYLIYRYFDNVASFPRIKGSCGHYYAVELASPGPVLSTQPLAVTEDLPWGVRRDVALKFLDLLADLDSSLDGRFHLCDVKAENFGITEEDELKVIDVDLAFFSKRLFEQFDLETCRSDKDCRVLDCQGKCDMERKTCSKMRVNSNLQTVCRKIFTHTLATGYRGLLRYPPAFLSDPMDGLLIDCSTMSSENPNFNDEVPETMFYKLKNLLKKPLANRIADYVGFR